MPDNWDKSADKNRDRSSFCEKMFGRFQFFLIQKEIFSEFSDEGFASIISYRIRYQRSDDTSQRTDYNHPLKTKLFHRNQESCERHNRFARHRQNHTLHYHSNKNRDISGLMDKRSDIGCKKFSDSHTKLTKRLKDCED